jgi:hypothetical protein
MSRAISWYQRRLALKGIKSIVTNIKILKEDGFKNVDYTKQMQNDPNDTVDTIKVNKDMWDNYIDKGLFTAQVFKIPEPLKQSKNGNLMLIIPLEFLDGINKGKKSSYTVTYTDKALGGIKRMYDNTGIPYKIDETGNLTVDRKAMFKLMVKTKVDEDTYLGKTTNKIKMLYSKDYVPEE